MDPQTFTLEGVFAMQLHEYSDVISNVVNNAQREVVIEKVQAAMMVVTFDIST